MSDQERYTRLGLAAALGAFLMWGVLPLYFYLLKSVPPDLMLAHRILFSLVTGFVLFQIGGGWSGARAVLADRRLLFMLFVSGALIGSNWLVYIWAVQNERVIEASLGYYINPLVSFALGALLFGERFSWVQLFAILLAALGVMNQTLVVGQFPYAGLYLCFSFAFYGAIRKKAAVDGRLGFLIETSLLAPLAAGYLVFKGAAGASILPDGAELIVLLAMSGLITASPLILFAIAAKRLRLSTIGVMQYIGPSIQMMLGVWVFNEAFTLSHAVTFGLIWAGVILFSVSAWRADRRQRVSGQGGAALIEKKNPLGEDAAAG